MKSTPSFPQPVDRVRAGVPADADGATPYQTVARAIAYLAEQRERQPGLDELAGVVGLSPTHLQRLFTAWAGVSPKRFLQALTRAHARRLLQEARAVLPAALEAGLSGGGRLYDLFMRCEAVTPGEVARLGHDLRIEHGLVATPFGPALLGYTARGICHLRFADDGAPAALAELSAEWPRATLVGNGQGAAELARRVFPSGVAAENLQTRPLALWLRGTNFQFQVWRALLAVPEGGVTHYGELARAIGRPGAARAVGGAVGANPVAWLIPCHRVIRASGALGDYRWGTTRKQAMLVRESAVRGAVDDTADLPVDFHVHFAGASRP